MTCQQGMLTPPRHLIPPLVHVHPGVLVCLALSFVLFFLDYNSQIDYGSLSLPFHVNTRITQKYKCLRIALPGI